MDNFNIPPFVYAIGPVLVALVVFFNIINWWTEKSKKYPEGSHNQKFSTFAKRLVIAGIVIGFGFSILADMIAPSGSPDDTVTLILGWVVFIGYGIFIYNKIYLQDKNSKRTDDPTTLTKVETSTTKPKQEEKPKEKLSWDEPPKVEEKKVEPIKTEVTITAEEEEKIYADVARELKDNRREGLWTKGFAECGGDEKKTKLYYVKNRVKALMEELKETKRKE